MATIIENKWEVVELNEKCGRMLVGWHEGLVIFQIKKNDYYVDIELEEQETKKWCEPFLFM